LHKINTEKQLRKNRLLLHIDKETTFTNKFFKYTVAEVAIRTKNISLKLTEKTKEDQINMNTVLQIEMFRVPAMYLSEFLFKNI